MSALPFTYLLRRSQRATRVRIVVKPGSVEVVAPPKVPESKIVQFIHAKQQWIMSALGKMQAKGHLANNGVASIVYGHGADVFYQGRIYQLATKPSKLKNAKVEFVDGFIAHVPESLQVEQHSDAIRGALERWMKKQAKVHVEHLVNRHAPRKQLFPQSIKIKTQKSRWGSCGIHNDININWLLVMAPAEVLEYVVVHELCHIQQRNHSRHFWALVEEHLPGYQQHRVWLKKHGSHLMRGL
ncbi:MAG: SprT family zinc-dependent metalloprotease [Methylococcaceae bacterium]|nr:SprT family zinc-dependent metalloprotease [Methylococcaceae bacterium]